MAKANIKVKRSKIVECNEFPYNLDLTIEEYENNGYELMSIASRSYGNENGQGKLFLHFKKVE